MHTSTLNALDLSLSPSNPSDSEPSSHGELSLESLEEIQGGIAPLVVVAAFAAGTAFGFILGQASK